MYWLAIYPVDQVKSAIMVRLAQSVGAHLPQHDHCFPGKRQTWPCQSPCMQLAALHVWLPASPEMRAFLHPRHMTTGQEKALASK